MTHLNFVMKRVSGQVQTVPLATALVLLIINNYERRRKLPPLHDGWTPVTRCSTVSHLVTSIVSGAESPVTAV